MTIANALTSEIEVKINQPGFVINIESDEDEDYEEDEDEDDASLEGDQRLFVMDFFFFQQCCRLTTTYGQIWKWIICLIQTQNYGLYLFNINLQLELHQLRSERTHYNFSLGKLNNYFFKFHLFPLVRRSISSSYESRAIPNERSETVMSMVSVCKEVLCSIQKSSQAGRMQQSRVSD